MEERWEALEECERAFEITRLRISTDEIGLARVGEGLELVRIGKPKRPEFAAWRYGDQFGRRRRRRYIMGAAGVVALGSLGAGQMATGITIGGFAVLNVVQFTHGLWNFYRRGKTLTTIQAHGQTIPVTAAQIESAQLIWSRSKDDFSLLLPWKSILASLSKPPRHIIVSQEAEEFLRKSFRWSEGIAELHGEDARYGLAKIIAQVNANGASSKVVKQAVEAVEKVGEADQFMRETAKTFAANRPSADIASRYVGGGLRQLPRELRLGMEMAVNEENERNVLLGELELLKEEWRAAEEIASISDKLLVSRAVQEDLQGLKTKAPQS